MPPEDLLRECLVAYASGLDFPITWRTIIRVHPLVAGPAIQRAEAGLTWLEVPLTTGHRIKHDDTTGYTLIPPFGPLAAAQ